MFLYVACIATFLVYGLSFGLLGEGGCARVSILRPLMVVSGVHLVLYLVVGYSCCATLGGMWLCWVAGGCRVVAWSCKIPFAIFCHLPDEK
jgi:hypothetical protein